MHNAARARSNLHPLDLEGKLNRAAFLHCKWMAANAKMTHEQEDGSDVGDRVKAEGFVWGCVAENIAEGQQTCAEVMIKWLHSPGHNANIHDIHVNVMGACCLFSVQGAVRRPYWCVVFARAM
jgi:uncharacterized protein YkwD